MKVDQHDIIPLFKEIQEELWDRGFTFERTDFNRPWGGFFVIEETQSELFIQTYYPDEDAEQLTKGGKVSPKILVVLPEKRLSWQYHHRRSEVWKLIKGEAGIVMSDTDEPGDVQEMKIGEIITIPQGTRHRLIGLGPIGIVAEIWQHTDPENPSNENDIIRLQDDFGR